MKVQVLKGCADDDYLKAMFSWLSRIGAAPKFGSRPIGWYQIHQMKAIEFIEWNVPNMSRLRTRDGQIQFSKDGKWHPLVTAYWLYNYIDDLCRKS